MRHKSFLSYKEKSKEAKDDKAVFLSRYFQTTVKRVKKISVNSHFSMELSVRHRRKRRTAVFNWSFSAHDLFVVMTIETNKK